MSATLTWIVPPSTISTAVGQYGDRVLVAVKAVADFMAQKMQDEMRQNARWQDRTGNARTGLFSVTERAAKDIVDLYLSHGHTVWYGVFLETYRGAKYAIIMPTLQRNLGELERMLKTIFAD